MANQTAPDRTPSDQLRRCPDTGVVLRNQLRQYDKEYYDRKNRRRDFTSFYIELLKEPGRREVVRCWANDADMARQVGELLIKRKGYWKVGRVLRARQARQQLPKWWRYLRGAEQDCYYARDELGLNTGQPVKRKEKKRQG